MGTYYYKDLKKIARKVKAELAGEASLTKKKLRLKPRSPEKTALLFEMAITRLERYKPYRTENGIVLPYFYADRAY